MKDPADLLFLVLVIAVITVLVFHWRRQHQSEAPFRKTIYLRVGDETRFSLHLKKFWGKWYYVIPAKALPFVWEPPENQIRENGKKQSFEILKERLKERHGRADQLLF